MHDQSSQREAYDQLCFYTLSHPDPAFIHQYVVDAYAAQYADGKSTPIGVDFVLADLYLHLEKGYTGREVQLAHMRLATEKKELPVFKLPASRGDVTSKDVLRAAPGAERDQAIREWSASVWQAWSGSHERVVEWVTRELGIQ